MFALEKFGRIKNKYRILLQKAGSFSIIVDMEHFITESICNVENNICLDSDAERYLPV